jgi:phosphoenolpyruvate synthase/pyruvate phosphate dikinase
MAEFAVPLTSIKAADERLVGAKSARLHHMISLGLPVPEGICVTTNAFHAFCDQNGMREKLDILPTEACHELIQATELPSIIRDAILAHYSCLKDHPMAVRSSAVGEDSSEASFAGQYESYLGVLGTGELFRHIKFVWASLFSERAIDYRKRRGMSYRDTPMSVCVLKLVDAHAAGVAFSADPISGKRDRIVIEAAWGLGEAVVQGRVTPERIVIDKEELREMSRAAGEMREMLAFDPSQRESVWSKVPIEVQKAKVLEHDVSLSIGRLVIDLESRVDHAVDLEWALSKQAQIYAVQFRPITKLPEAPPAPYWSPTRSVVA